MKRLNVGCGSRVADGWINIDVESSDPRVRRVNLLEGFPFPDQYFDAVYSSHVLEHFSLAQGQGLLREVRRVLKAGGVARMVVPDLEGTCREYLRILDLPDADPAKAGKYAWILIELLDQMVRTVPSGEMGPFISRLRASGADPELLSYICARTRDTSGTPSREATMFARLRRVTRSQLAAAMGRGYLKAVACLIPAKVREMVFVKTAMGERHRWMYDRYGLLRLLESAGFEQCRLVSHDESGIPGFRADRLDSNPDGSRYKLNSLYVEGTRGGEAWASPLKE